MNGTSKRALIIAVCTTALLMISAGAPPVAAVHTVCYPADTGCARVEGWSYPPGLQAPLEDWLYSTGSPILSSPKTGDVVPGEDKEIVVTTYGPPENPYGAGKVYVLSSAGEVLPGWPYQTSGPVPASPALGDLEGDGDIEIVVASWNAVYAFHHDGSMVSGWPVYGGGYRSATLYDLDDDGDLEIVIPANREIKVFNHDGSRFSTPTLQDLDNFTAVCVVDLDRDGELEILAGNRSGKVHCWDLEGDIEPGWPVELPGQVLSAPAVADIDGDGDYEVFVNYYNRQSGENDGLYGFDHAGIELSGFPVSAGYSRLSSPSFADLDGDRLPEIICGGWTAEAPDYYETIYAFDADGSTLPGFPVLIDYSPSGNINSSVVVADIDGDESPELLVKGADNLHAYHADGGIVSGFPKFLDDQNHSGTTSPTPCIDDLDRDGDLEIVACANFDRVFLFDLDDQVEAGAFPWPSYRHDSFNTGTFGFQPVTSVETEAEVIPGQFELLGNYPNPFNDRTVIAFRLSRPSMVEIELFDISGRLVCRIPAGFMAAGRQTAVFDSDLVGTTDFPSGLYLYRVGIGGVSSVGKMVYLK